MQEGEQSLIRCESRFAYGPDGCPPTKPDDKDVPPDADIEVLVELLQVLSTTPLSGMTLEEKVAEGQRKKAVGNDHFARKAYKNALRSYTSACNAIADAEIPDKESKVFLEARQLRIDCGNNIATSCVRLGELEKAKNATVEVLELDPVNTKALFRAGQVSSLQSNFNEANLALRKALELNPESREIQAELRLLLERTKAYKAKRHNMQETMGRSLVAGGKLPQKVPKGSNDNPVSPASAALKASTLREGTGETVASRPRGAWRAGTPMTLISGRCGSMSEYVIVALIACVLAYLLWQSSRWSTRSLE